MNPPIVKLIEKFQSSAAAVGFEVETFGRVAGWPLIALSRKSTTAKAQNIYLSSGIHGDEPAGTLALLQLLQDDALPRRHNYWICPVLNPSGLEARIRENAHGLDLNRPFSLSISLYYTYRRSRLARRYVWAVTILPAVRRPDE